MFVLTFLVTILVLAVVGAAILGVAFELDQPLLACGAVTGIILHGYLLFALCSTKILYNGFAATLLILGLLVAAAAAMGGARWWSRALGRLSAFHAVEVACLLVLFLGFAWVRAHNPQIWGEEKFMDFMFLNGIWRSEWFPPNDPWFAGGTINYYYFGYLLVADLARLTGIPTAYLYNLALGMWFALSFTAAYEIGYTLTGRIRYALLSGVLLAICGNLDGAFQLLDGHVADFSYWKSSRIVDPDNTINEFPFFSFIHADLHPHVMSIPILLLLLFLLLRLLQRPALVLEGSFFEVKKLPRWLLLAVVLGALPCTNVADVPTFWGLTCLTFGLLILRPRSESAEISSPGFFARVRSVAPAAVVPLVVGFLLYLPFHRYFQSAQVQGLGWVSRRSVWTEFMVVHGLFFFVLVADLATRLGPLDPARARERREPYYVLLGAIGIGLGLILDSLILGLMSAMTVALFVSWCRPTRDVAPDEDYVSLLTLGALGLLAGCEVVFVRDFYGGELERLNTVFKFYYQAWILLALITPWCLFKLGQRFAGVPGFRFWRWGFFVLLTATLVYPVLGTRARYFREPPANTLYGMDHLVDWHADEHEAMLWLQQAAPRDARLLELSGPPYGYHGRYAANTGIPTLLGWVQHEAFWRDNSYTIPREREAEVKRIYDAPALSEDVRTLLDRYGVRFIIVGELEKKEVSAGGLAKFAQLPVLFQKGDVTIYGWSPSRS